MSGLDVHIRRFWPTPVGFVRAYTATPPKLRKNIRCIRDGDRGSRCCITHEQTIAKQIFTVAFAASAPAFRSNIVATKSLSPALWQNSESDCPDTEHHIPTNPSLLHTCISEPAQPRRFMAWESEALGLCESSMRIL